MNVRRRDGWLIPQADFNPAANPDQDAINARSERKSLRERHSTEERAFALVISREVHIAMGVGVPKARRPPSEATTTSTERTQTAAPLANACAAQRLSRRYDVPQSGSGFRPHGASDAAIPWRSGRVGPRSADYKRLMKRRSGPPRRLDCIA